jgi:predicted DsbA family dithiol-disulfide isomerase
MMLVEIWSDVVCPWCYIGKRRFETALARFAHADEVEVVWRSFELDPSAPRDGSTVDLVEHLATKYGTDRAGATRMLDRVTEQAAGEGLDYHLDVAKRGSSFDAHRLIHAAAAQGKQGEMKERLLRAYFTEAVAIADRDELRRLAAEVGVDASAIDDDDAFAADVREDIRTARELGVSGVPFFAIDRRYGIGGAQDPETILDALNRAWTERASSPA